MPLIWQVTCRIAFFFIMESHAGCFSNSDSFKKQSWIIQGSTMFLKTTDLPLSKIQQLLFINVTHWWILISSYLLKVTKKNHSKLSGENYFCCKLTRTDLVIYIRLFLVDMNSLQSLEVHGLIQWKNTLDQILRNVKH